MYFNPDPSLARTLEEFGVWHENGRDWLLFVDYQCYSVCTKLDNMGWEGRLHKVVPQCCC